MKACCYAEVTLELERIITSLKQPEPLVAAEMQKKKFFSLSHKGKT